VQYGHYVKFCVLVYAWLLAFYTFVNKKPFNIMLNSILDYFSKWSIKKVVVVTCCIIALLLVGFSFTSCGLTGKVQGNRKIEKTIIHEQQYEVGKDKSTVLTTRSTYSTVKNRS